MAMIRTRSAVVLGIALAALATSALGRGAAAESATYASPALAERLERLVTELEGRREELHIPGMAIAVVKDGEIVLTRGFGAADVEQGTPVTAETLFPIGSSTKSFTATLIAMLVDEGTMAWDDPVTKYLPYFGLKVDSDDPEAEVTIRDMLCHRTGFPRMSLLAASNVGREKILRTAVKAEPYVRFREKWQYNNVMYLAAGVAAGEAAGSDWDTLIRRRIFAPLGMRSSTTTIHDLPEGATMAVGYTWEGYREYYRPQDLLVVDSIAPAGAINSNAVDTARWLQCLLADGEYGGRLISEEQLAETWRPQIEIDEGTSYGLGWIITDWRGQPLLVHGGNTPGFSAQMALLPDSDLGFVLLTNAFASKLQPMSIGLVCDALLGDWQEGTGESEDYAPYLGTYLPTYRDAEFEVLEQNGQLALKVPDQGTFELKPPDEEGKRRFALTDQVAVSFQRDEAGEVALMTIYQAGMEFECIPEGVAIPPEADPAELQQYLGTYHSEERKADAEVFIQNNRLAIGFPWAVIAELRAPDEQGLRAFRFKSTSAVKFNTGDDGRVASFTYHENGDPQEVLPRVAGAKEESLASVEDIHALRQSDRRKAAAAALGTCHFSGTVRVVNSGVDGKADLYLAGADRMRQHLDFGIFGQLTTIVDGDAMWSQSSVMTASDQGGAFVDQVKQGHPAANFGDWREFFDAIRVLRAGELDGRRVYVVQLKQGDAPAHAVSVDAETGDVLQDERMLLLPGGNGALPILTRYEDYREVHGLRIPFRMVTSNDVSGRTVMQFERMEVGLEVDQNTFSIPADGE